jgi:hypothetical protein
LKTCVSDPPVFDYSRTSTYNGQELTPEELDKLPLFQIFQLYIDPVGDIIHPEIRNLPGFDPIDDPLL